MATPASIRLPLRLLSRRSYANPIPSTHLLRSQPSADYPKPFSQQHALQATTNPNDPVQETSSQNKSPTPPPSSANAAAGRPTAPSPAWTPREPTDTSLLSDVRLPRAVQATYLRPLRKQAQYGVPSCDLQMRSYSVRNLEFFADFAMRAAYYLGLPAYGPVPLPRIVERWTVPRASFIYKKSQENFERKTLRRLIQIKDGHPDAVRVWLAFLRKHQYYGVGMKANVWAYEELDVAKNMDAELENMKQEADETWQRLGLNDHNATAEKVIEFINKEDRAAASGTKAPMAKVDPQPI